MSNNPIELLKAQELSDTPFKFNELPMLIKGKDVFKAPLSKGEPSYIDMTVINAQIAKMRRLGKFPTFMLRMPNLEYSIAACLLDVRNHNPDAFLHDDIYVYMDQTTGLNPGINGPINSFQAVVVHIDLETSRLRVLDQVQLVRLQPDQH